MYIIASRYFAILQKVCILNHFIFAFLSQIHNLFPWQYPWIQETDFIKDTIASKQTTSLFWRYCIENAKAGLHVIRNIMRDTYFCVMLCSRHFLFAASRNQHVAKNLMRQGICIAWVNDEFFCLDKANELKMYGTEILVYLKIKITPTSRSLKLT